MSYYDYERLIANQMDSLRMQLLARPLNLGGVSSVDGGAGGPPGGFIGYLPQTRVSYDQTEAAVSGTSVSGSLLDNLNHIRYRLSELESTGTISVVDIQTTSYAVTTQDEVVIGNSTSAITFTLPVASGTGRSFSIKNINTGTVTVSGYGTDTIDSLAAQSIYRWESITVLDYTAGGWIIL